MVLCDGARHCKRDRHPIGVLSVLVCDVLHKVRYRIEPALHAAARDWVKQHMLDASICKLSDTIS